MSAGSTPHSIQRDFDTMAVAIQNTYDDSNRRDALESLKRIEEQYEAQRTATQEWYEKAIADERRANRAETQLAATKLALGDCEEQLEAVVKALRDVVQPHPHPHHKQTARALLADIDAGTTSRPYIRPAEDPHTLVANALAQNPASRPS